MKYYGELGFGSVPGCQNCCFHCLVERSRKKSRSTASFKPDGKSSIIRALE
jgi:hypothetical protein